MPIRTTIRCHYKNLQELKKNSEKNRGKDVKKLERSYSTGENVKWYSHSWKQFESFLQNQT